jgi:hypothetical protein
LNQVAGNTGSTRTVADVGADAVQLHPLDSFGLAPDVMKIDVEGSEFDVVAGALGTIRAHRPAIFVELHHRRREMEALLRPFGYLRIGGSWAASPTYLFVARHRHQLKAAAAATRRNPRAAIRRLGRLIR